MGKFSTQFSQIEENIGMYYVDKQAKALQEKTELKIEEMYPVGEKVTVEEKGIMKTEKTELVYKVMELSQRKIEKVNLYWLEQEKIGMKTKEKYLIDVENGKVYQYDGLQIYGLIWHTLDNGIEPGTVNEEMWSTIDIEVTPQDTATTQIDISISYGESTEKQYKIGQNNTIWSEYTQEITLTSMEVLTNNWKNDDNTITIYAKAKNKLGKEISQTYKILNLDIDLPQKPVIKSNYGYPIISTSGIKSDGKTSITYDQRDDIDNLYSIDNGATWQKYEGEFTIASPGTIIAKSVKKVSKLEISEQLQVNAKGDAISSATYDGNSSTSVRYGPNNSKRIQVDSSMWGKPIYVTATENSQPNGSWSASCIVTAYLNNGTSTRMYITPSANIGYTRRAMNIPENTEYIVFSTQSHSNMFWVIYELYAN